MLPLIVQSVTSTKSLPEPGNSPSTKTAAHAVGGGVATDKASQQRDVVPFRIKGAAIGLCRVVGECTVGGVDGCGLNCAAETGHRRIVVECAVEQSDWVAVGENRAGVAAGAIEGEFAVGNVNLIARRASA